MESMIFLSLYVKSDVLKHIFENLEPFLNIVEQDGIYFYRIIIILKMVFLLHTPKYVLPKHFTWLMLAIANAFIVYKYMPVAAVLMVLQCLIFFVLSKKFAHLLSMTWICSLSMNIKSCEFILDVSATLCLITHALQIYCHDLQKLWTIVTIKLCIAWYVCSLHTFNAKQFFLIVCFLFLTYIPLKPHNKHKLRLLYFYVLVLSWIAYKFHVTNFHEAKILTDNSKLHKWGYNDSIVTPSNIAEKVTFTNFRNPKALNASRGKLSTKYVFDNLTSYSDFRENICRVDDENVEIMDKNFKSKKDLLQPKINLSSENVKKVTRETNDGKGSRSKSRFFKENQKLRFLTSIGESKLRNNPEKSFLVDDEIILSYSLESIQMMETKNEKRKLHKTGRKSSLFNNEANEELPNNEEKVIEYEKSLLNEPVWPLKYKRNKFVTLKEVNVDSNLKRETRISGTKINAKRETRDLISSDPKWLKNEKKIIEYLKYSLNEPIRLSKHKQQGLVVERELMVDSNFKRERKTMGTKVKKKSKTRNLISSDPERLKNEGKLIEYKKPPLNTPFRLSKYKQQELDSKKELQIHSSLKRETNALRTTTKNKKMRIQILKGPHVLKFKTLTDIAKENNERLEHMRFNKIKTDLKKESLITDAQKSAKRKKCIKNEQEKVPGY